MQQAWTAQTCASISPCSSVHLHLGASKPLSLVIFSDLDGTLLDHERYSFAPAIPALTKLLELRIPLVLASSKTAVELIDIRSEMGFSHCPAIIENGAGLLAADTVSADQLDQSGYYKLLQIIRTAPEELRTNFSGFADWSLEDIAGKTGLTVSACKKAATRQFSEPGLWSGTDDDLEAYKTWLAENGITLQRGGRFVTHSFGADKASRMCQIMEIYGISARANMSLALGDAPNDIGMLEAADHGVIVWNPEVDAVPLLSGEQNGKIIRTELAGPQGWNEAVLSFVSQTRF